MGITFLFDGERFSSQLSEFASENYGFWDLNPDILSFIQRFGVASGIFDFCLKDKHATNCFKNPLQFHIYQRWIEGAAQEKNKPNISWFFMSQASSRVFYISHLATFEFQVAINYVVLKTCTLHDQRFWIITFVRRTKTLKHRFAKE